MEEIIALLIFVAFLGLMIFAYWCLSRVERQKYVHRKKYLEDRMLEIHQMHSNSADAVYAMTDYLREYVIVCTRMYYKDYEISDMLARLLPPPDYE